LPVIVDSQHKTSSTTICTLLRLLPQNHSPSVHLGKQHYPRTCQGASTRDDAGEGGLHVSDQNFIISRPPSPAPHPPTANIHRLVDYYGCGNNFLRSLGRNHYKAIALKTPAGTILSAIEMFRQSSLVQSRNQKCGDVKTRKKSEEWDSPPKEGCC